MDKLDEAVERGTGRGDLTGLPYVALLGRAESALAQEFDRRLASSEFCALSLAHWRNVLRHLGNEPQRASQMISHCHVTKQALSQQIAHLERDGYLESVRDPLDQRARLISLTEKGRVAQKVVRGLLAELDHDWRQRLGPDDAAALRRILTRVIDEGSPGDC